MILSYKFRLDFESVHLEKADILGMLLETPFESLFGLLFWGQNYWNMGDWWFVVQVQCLWVFGVRDNDRKGLLIVSYCVHD